MTEPSVDGRPGGTSEEPSDVAKSDPSSDCLFCRIVAGEIPATVVRRSANTLSFRDINPQAPTHVLVIPLNHHVDLPTLAARDPEVLTELVLEAAAVAADEGHAGFRLIANVGPEAGQSVFHTHAHVLAGGPMPWPPA